MLLDAWPPMSEFDSCHQPIPPISDSLTSCPDSIRFARCLISCRSVRRNAAEMTESGSRVEPVEGRGLRHGLRHGLRAFDK